MTARWCDVCGKDGHRSRGAACAAASSYSFKRDTPLRVYHSEVCSFWHISSKVGPRDLVA